ncbi:hypothetical protein DZA53_08470 [Xanthomonas oryzae pv. oryzae]|nr:hypothetical protein DZA53_08470 [Xanthomonas oryzae pv. oryzae]
MSHPAGPAASDDRRLGMRGQPARPPPTWPPPPRAAQPTPLPVTPTSPASRAPARQSHFHPTSVTADTCGALSCPMLAA